MPGICAAIVGFTAVQSCTETEYVDDKKEPLNKVLFCNRQSFTIAYN